MQSRGWFDGLLARTILPLIPRRVTPNELSALRLLLVPAVAYCAIRGAFDAALALFLLAVATDVLDGALARTRALITERGKVLDAVADRALILTSALLFSDLLGWPLLIAILTLEGVNAVAAYAARRRLGENPGANGAGKLKMHLQSAGIACMLAGASFETATLVSVGSFALALSIVPLLVQPFRYPRYRSRAPYG